MRVTGEQITDDLDLLLGAAVAAWDGRRGAWAEFADASQRHGLICATCSWSAGSTTSRSRQASDCGSGRTTSSRPAKTSASRHGQGQATPGRSQLSQPASPLACDADEGESGPSLRTPNFAPDGLRRPGKTQLRTAVGRHLLARRKSGVQIPSPPPHRYPGHRPGWSLPLGRRHSRAAAGQQTGSNRERNGQPLLDRGHDAQVYLR